MSDSPAFRVAVDRTLCIGSGNCVRLTGGAFALDDEDIAVFVDPGAADDTTLERAERSCPTGAISLRPTTGDR